VKNWFLKETIVYDENMSFDTIDIIHIIYILMVRCTVAGLVPNTYYGCIVASFIVYISENWFLKRVLIVFMLE